MFFVNYDSTEKAAKDAISLLEEWNCIYKNYREALYESENNPSEEVEENLDRLGTEEQKLRYDAEAIIRVCIFDALPADIEEWIHEDYDGLMEDLEAVANGTFEEKE